MKDIKFKEDAKIVYIHNETQDNFLYITFVLLMYVVCISLGVNLLSSLAIPTLSMLVVLQLVTIYRNIKFIEINKEHIDFEKDPK